MTNENENANAPGASLKPLRDLVLVELSTTTRTHTLKGADGRLIDLIVPTSASHEQPWGRVVSIGPDTKHVRSGNVVLIDESSCIRVGNGDVLRVGSADRGNTLSSNGPGRVLIAEPDVLAIIENE